LSAALVNVRPSEFHGARARAVVRKVTPLPVSSAGAAVPLKDFVELSLVAVVVRIDQLVLDNRAKLRPAAAGLSARNLVSRFLTGGRSRSGSGGGRWSRAASGSGGGRWSGSGGGRWSRAVSGSNEYHAAGTGAVAGEVTPLPANRAGAAVPVKDFVELSFVVLVVRCVQFAFDNRAILRLWALSASDRASCVHTRRYRDSGVSQEDEEGTFK
jgi:hypothetical protein